MLVSPGWGISVHLPADWFQVEWAPGSIFAVSDVAGNTITASSSMFDSDQPGNSLEETADLFEEIYPSQIGDADLLSRTAVKTSQGVDAIRMDWSILNGLARQGFLMVIDSGFSTDLVTSSSSEDYDGLKETFDYILESLITR